jgi:Zn-dependent protease
VTAGASASRCPQCGTEIAATLFACPVCHRLVHADLLKQIAAEAEKASQAGDRSAALAAWRRALDLLPPDSRQYATVTEKVAALSREVDAKPESFAEAQTRSTWAKRLGALGVFGALLWKFKFALGVVLTKGKLLLVGLTKSSTLFSMILSLGVYWEAWGWKFAAGLIGSIYIHEMGHVAMLRRYGIPATAPMFIPGLGAVIRLKQYPADVRESARVGLAGPMWGLGTALACYAAFMLTGTAFWGAIARVGAWLNLFNLIPIWQLDGGRGFDALSRRQRWLATAVVVAAWLFTKEGLLVVLALAGVFRAWGGPAPEQDDPRAFWEYVILVGLLSVLSAVPVPMGALD